MTSVPVRRLEAQIAPDRERVVARPFIPGDFSFPGGHARMVTLVHRILAMSEEETARQLDGVRRRFGGRHPSFERLVQSNADHVLSHLPEIDDPPPQLRTLVGAFFTQEYAVEAAAVFNPSMVPAPAQEGVAEGALRVVVSLRGTGEGHVSSIELRTAVVTSDGDVVLDPPADHAVTGAHRTPEYDKVTFVGKLRELGADHDVLTRIVAELPGAFTMAQLEAALLREVPDERASVTAHETARLVHWLASSNYLCVFAEDTEIGARVLMPQSPSESRGMEDARFVRFVDDDGSICYRATYTAFDGIEILPQMIETQDFRTFRIMTLNGDGAQNKGMALFPRRVGGDVLALSRNDRESIFLMRTDNPHWWRDPQLLRRPTHPWELMQTGNCGSPIETDAGWLVLTHGVGPMRRYVIGAMLLDRDDPLRVIGDLRDPLLQPDPDERDGYVPNVVYSCGALVHAGNLVVPYGYSDYGCRFAAVELDALLDALLADGPASTSP